MKYDQHVIDYYSVRTYCLSCGMYLEPRVPYCIECRGGR